MASISEILIEITGGINPICSIKEVATVLNKSEQSTYGYRAGTSEPLWSDVVRLSQYLIKEYGYYRLSMQPVLNTAKGDSNGEVSDELMKIFEAATDLNRAFRANNKEAEFWKAYNTIADQVAVLKEEGDKRFGKH